MTIVLRKTPTRFLNPMALNEKTKNTIVILVKKEIDLLHTEQFNLFFVNNYLLIYGKNCFHR